MRRQSDRGARHKDNLEEYGKELYEQEYLPGDAEAGGVLLSDEDQVAKQEQSGHCEPDEGEHARRLGIRLHVGPVRAAANVGAVALVEACAPHPGAGCAE